jgi:hypothetical protein
MNKTVMGMLMVGLAGLGGCASSGVAQQHGSIVMAPHSVRAIATGPAELRAYTLDGGGRVFVVDAKTGTDADCVDGARGTREATVAVDRRNVVTLASGQLACVASSGHHDYELLWRSRPADAGRETVLVAQARR